MPSTAPVISKSKLTSTDNQPDMRKVQSLTSGAYLKQGKDRNRLPRGENTSLGALKFNKTNVNCMEKIEKKFGIQSVESNVH